MDSSAATTQSMTQIVWIGPVSIAQVGDTSLPGAKTGFIQCKGDGTPTCGQIADAWPSTKVASMLGAAQLEPSDSGDVVMRAFSAGGSTAKRVCLGSDWQRLTAVVLSDATYTSWASPGVPLAPEGFVKFALSALDGNKAFIATASSTPNNNLPNGSLTLFAIKDEIEKRSGIKFNELTSIDGMPVQPVKAWSYGSVLLADYGILVTHSQHATLLAQPIWQNVVRPWLLGPPKVGPIEPSPSKTPIHVPVAQTGDIGAVPLYYWAMAGAGAFAGAMAVKMISGRS